MGHFSPSNTFLIWPSDHPEKFFRISCFFIFNQKNIFDSGPESMKQFFSKNITTINGYLSIDPSTMSFKLKIIKFVLL